MSLSMIPALFFSVCLTLMAQDSNGTGVAILRHATATYKSLRSERVEATVIMDMQTYRIETSITGAIVRPGKARLEVINSMLGSQTVTDGHSVWKYVPSFGQYTKKPASPGILPIPDGPADILTGETILDGLRSAKVQRREKLTVDGKQVRCDVIEATYVAAGSASGPGRTKTFWVDSHRRLILKISSLIKMNASEPGGMRGMVQSITVNSIKINEPLRDSLFVFTPPESAKEVAELVPPGGKSK